MSPGDAFQGIGFDFLNFKKVKKVRAIPIQEPKWIC